MKYLFVFFSISILILGCSKEDSSTTSTSEGSNSVSMSFFGKVAQGYIEGAKVFADLDSDRVRDSNEAQATSDSGGCYTLQVEPGNWTLISQGGTFLDSQGNKINALPMKAPAPTTSGAIAALECGSTQISSTAVNITPLTSLVAANSSLKSKFNALGGNGWNSDIASSSGVPGKLLRISQTVEQALKTLSSGDYAILSSDTAKLKTMDKLADAFTKQKNISSKEALTAAVQEGLVNALNDEQVVILTLTQKKIKGAFVDAAKVAVEGVASAISDTSESVVESSVALTLETALDNATSVVNRVVNLVSNPKYAKFCGGTSLKDNSSCPSIDNESFLAVARFGYVVFSE